MMEWRTRVEPAFTVLHCPNGVVYLQLASNHDNGCHQGSPKWQNLSNLALSSIYRICILPEKDKYFVVQIIILL